MEIAIEWEGISGVIKIILFVGFIFFIGLLVGKNSKWNNYVFVCEDGFS